MAQDVLQDAEKRNLESLIARYRPKKRDSLREMNLGNALFIEYFSSNISNKQLIEALDKNVDLFTVLAIDYFQRFGGRANKSRKFLKLETEEIIDYFQNPNYIEVDDLKFEKVDKKGLLEFLVEERGFSKENVVNGLKKVIKQQRQSSLSSFF